MKIKLLLLFFGLLSIVACNKRTGKGSAGSGSTTLSADIDSVSYALGIDVGNTLKMSGIEELNLAAFDAGIEAVLNNDTAKALIKMDATRPIVMAYIEKAYKKQGEANKKAGVEFLAENKKNKDVKSTPSGLQYIVLKAGNGPIPADTSLVKVHYHGTLIDGTVFDSSVDRNEPAEFQVNGVVVGWQEVLGMMPVGSKWKVFLPSELAYGENPRRGGKIGPNMVLIFEMELLEILPPRVEEAPINPANFKNLKTK